MKKETKSKKVNEKGETLYTFNLDKNPYARLANDQTNDYILATEKDILKTRSGILKEIVINMNFLTLVGKHYNRITSTQVKYKVFKGAKGTKKSETVIGYIIFRMLIDPKYNAIVLRRYMSDHQDTTVAGFSTVLQRMQSRFKYNYLDFWKLSSPTSNTPVIYYNRKGVNAHDVYRQEVRMLSWENINGMSSSKWHNGGYCGTLQWEEPLEKIDVKKKTKNGDDISDEFMQEKWPIMEETLLRYDSITNDPSKVFQDVILTFNSWNKYHFIVKQYVSAFLQENAETLERLGKQEYFDTNAHMGQGTYIMLMTWKVNEFRTDNEIKMIFNLKRIAPKEYRTIYLGLDYIYSGGVISDVLDHAKIVPEEDNEKWGDIQYGGDWSSSKDRSGMLEVKFQYKTGPNGNRIIKKIKLSSAMVFDAQKGNDIKRANLLLDWLDRRNENLADKYEHGEFPQPLALIDNRDAFWIDYMQTHKYAYGNAKYVHNLPANKHDTHENAAGVLSRVFAIRAVLLCDMVEMTQEIYDMLKEESETLIWIDEGKPKSDGNDDVFQMFGYSLSNKITLITQSTGISI